MKVGVITHYMPPHMGGIERVAEMLVNAYTQQGFDVRWVASRDPAGTALREGNRIRVPCWNGLERRLGVPVPLWGPPACREVIHLAGWADVLHVHDCLYPGSGLGILLGRKLGTPVLLTQHIGFIPYRAAALRMIERIAYATLGRWMLTHAGWLAFATPAAEAYGVELLGGYPHNACMVWNGIDTVRFRPAASNERQAARRHFGLPADRQVVLFVGRLVEKKGIDLVVEVSQRLPEAQFLVIGDGPLGGILPSGANIRWHRAVSPDRMQECYHASDCFLLPSHGEGLPLVVQEAAACGLPIVVSEGETYADLLVKGGVGSAAPRSGGAMAQRVRRILAGDRPDLGARARLHAEEQWSVSGMAARYISLLEAAVMQKRSPVRNV